VAGEGRLNQPDGIHPNEEGARRVATTVWRALQPLVATTGAAPLAASAAGGLALTGARPRGQIARL
jgi:acyl-CoA thioesterase-1